MRLNSVTTATLISSAFITTGLIIGQITHVALRALNFHNGFVLASVIYVRFPWGTLSWVPLIFCFQNDSVQTARIKFFAIGASVAAVAMRVIGSNAQWGYKGKVAEGAIALANGLLYTSLISEWAEEINRKCTVERQRELIRDLGKADAKSLIESWQQFDEFGKRPDVSTDDISSLFDDYLSFKRSLFRDFSFSHDISETTFLKLYECNNFTLKKIIPLLNLTENNPQQQIKLLQKHPFGSCKIELSDFNCKLHEETIDYLLQNDPTIWDLLFIFSKRDVTTYLLKVKAEDFIKITRHIPCYNDFFTTSIDYLFASLPEPTVTSIMEELVKTQPNWHKKLLDSIVLSKFETNILDLPKWYQNHVKFLSQEYLEFLADQFRKQNKIPLLHITLNAFSEETALKLMPLYYSYVIEGQTQAKDEQKITLKVREVIRKTISPANYADFHLDDTKYVLDMLDAFVCREDVTAANIRAWFNKWILQYDFWNLPTLNTDALSPAAIAKLRETLPESVHLLHLMQNHPQTQIDMMRNHPLKRKSIIHQSDRPIRYWYPKLHPDAIHVLLQKPSVTPIEIGICATQDENARKRLAEYSSLTVLAFFPCCEGGLPNACWDLVHCWDQSITKLVFDVFSDDMKKDLLSCMEASPWFPFVLESILQSKLDISDDILIYWANKNITAAVIVAKHKPHLLGRLDEALQPRVTQILTALKTPSKSEEDCKQDILSPYTHLVKELFTDDPNYFNNPDNFCSITDAMQTVRTMLTPEGWHYEPIPGTTAGDNIFDLLTKDVFSLICWRLSIRDRIRLARSCSALYNRICGHEGTAIWKKHGSIGALKRLHEIKDAVAGLEKNDTHIKKLTCKLLQLSWPGH